MILQERSPAKGNKDNRASIDDCLTRKYIEELRKENELLAKLIQERNKVIEVTGSELQKLRPELQKLRASLQKSQVQNWQLAQSNSQMLAELNIAKDRLKVLQHELACKEALWKSKTLEQEEKAKPQSQANGLQVVEIKPEKEAIQANNDNGKKVCKPKRKCPARSKSMGPTTSQLTVDKEKAENKRRCVRRQSVRFEPQQEPEVNMFEMVVANSPVRHSIDDSLCKLNSDMADSEEVLPKSSNASQLQRSSIGRPLRRAAIKVQTYREPLLNVKMRRSE